MITQKDFEQAIVENWIEDSPFENIVDTSKAAASCFELAKRMAKEENEKEGNWIKVSERLPDSRDVIVAYRHGVAESFYYKGRFLIPRQGNIEFPDVTHWMPLPSPPTK